MGRMMMMKPWPMILRWIRLRLVKSESSIAKSLPLRPVSSQMVYSSSICLTFPLPESRANIGTVQVPDLMQDLSQLDSMFSGGKPRVPFMTSLHDYIVGPPVGISEAGSGGDARFKGCNELVRNDCNESTRHEA